MKADALVELRVYTLKADTRGAFGQRFVEQILPMLQRYGITVLHAGPSLHDENSFCLIRAFSSPEARERQLDQLYGSEEWRAQQDEVIMAMIDHYSTCVVDTEALCSALAE